MRARRRYWLRDGNEEREIHTSALTLDCPFCGAPLGPAIGGGLDRPRCDCGAMVSRAGDPELLPPSPGVMADAFKEIRRRLKIDVVAQDDAVDRLALLGARHVHLGGCNRALIVGPPGSGKSTALVSLARILGCASLVSDVSTSSEAGWSGVDLNAAMAELYHGCDRDVERMERSLIILDEVCKIAVRDAKGSSREQKLGQQKNLLSLLSGGVPVRFAEHGDRGQAVAVVSDNMLIIAAGAFDGLPMDPGPGDLVAYGFMPELASRFPMLLSFSGLEPQHLAAVYRSSTTLAIRAAAEFGFEIIVPDSLLLYVANAVVSAGPHVTSRAGQGWVQAAVDTALLKLLDVGARRGTRYVLRPDDVRIPSSVRQTRA